MNLAEIRQRLIDEAAEFSELLRHSEEELKRSLRDVELSSYDNHPADEGTEVFERGKDIALMESAEHRLQNVQRALQKLSEGTYGRCDACGRIISPERLSALPSALRCIDCQAELDAREKEANRPVEEDLLSPPFGHVNFDEREDQTQFDSEDAWQEVARFNERFAVNYEEIEPDEDRGYVEPIEGFLITDLQGQMVEVANNNLLAEYKALLDGEGVSSILEFESESFD